MGHASRGFQLNTTTLCEQLIWQEHKLLKDCGRYASVPFNNRSLRKVAKFVKSSPIHSGRYTRVFAETTRFEPSAPFSCGDGDLSVSSDLQNDLYGHDTCHTGNTTNDGHERRDGNGGFVSYSRSAAARSADGVLNEQSGPQTCGDCSNERTVRASNLNCDNGIHLAGQHECASTDPSILPTYMDNSVADSLDVLSSTNSSNEATLLSDDAQGNAKAHGIDTMEPPNPVKTSRDSSHTQEVESNRKIRRFPLSNPGVLKNIQEERVLTPLERENLELLMKFKLTTDSLKGHLVIRAVRIEQLKDLENLLTDSYSELMWGPMTYRPVLAWILSTYLRERQAYLPNAATLVGLYAPTDEIKDSDLSSRKWWLAGAVEVSFNASGKPKDMQTPTPPEDAPFLSNMAVLKCFRRRGIGRELLKAAEQLVVQMGGKEMYLHCRMIDAAPLNMYKSAGYAVVETDNILSLLLLQRRRHLMYKALTEPLHEGKEEPVD